MRSYELGIVFHPDVEVPDVTEAYPIQKKEEGTYVFLKVQIEPRVVDELERSLKLDENILRYLLVHTEG